jgi:hypothetical protein
MVGLSSYGKTREPVCISCSRVKSFAIKALTGTTEIRLCARSLVNAVSAILPYVNFTVRVGNFCR